MTRFAAHGVATVVEFPNQVKVIQHNLQGTTVFQSAGTDNWLHLPLPAADSVNSRPQGIIVVLFVADLNENARIDEVRVTDQRSIRFQRSVSFIGELVRFREPTDPSFSLVQYIGGLVLTVHVDFLSGDPGGRAQLRSASVVTRNFQTAPE